MTTFLERIIDSGEWSDGPKILADIVEGLVNSPYLIVKKSNQYDNTLAIGLPFDKIICFFNNADGSVTGTTINNLVPEQFKEEFDQLCLAVMKTRQWLLEDIRREFENAPMNKETLDIIQLRLMDAELSKTSHTSEYRTLSHEASLAFGFEGVKFIEFDLS